MSHIAIGDLKRAQRGEEWYPFAHTVAVPVASGQTIRHGDLVEINSSGQATVVTGANGGIPTVTAIFGIANGSSAVVTADSELYPKILVKQLKHGMVVLRLLTPTGAPTTTSPTNIGKAITLRMGEFETEVAGVLGCNIKSGTDPVHGVVVDVIDQRFVLVKLDDDILAGG